MDGDPPAAYRYTEAKLAAVADLLMAELRQRTVDTRTTYDGRREEPTVLPAQFPNLLVNGASGIAVGMATNIPPHNLGSVIEAALYLIDNPDATAALLLDRLKGPDFPLGGKVVTDRTALRKIYEEGTGSIKMQGEWKVEETSRKRQIVITSIPYGVNKGNLEQAIGEIIATRKLPQLLSVYQRNRTRRKACASPWTSKADADPEMVMAYLYKHTALQENFAYNMTCLVPDSRWQTAARTARPQGTAAAFPRFPPGDGATPLRIRAGTTAGNASTSCKASASSSTTWTRPSVSSARATASPTPPRS